MQGTLFPPLVALFSFSLAKKKNYFLQLSIRYVMKRKEVGGRRGKCHLWILSMKIWSRIFSKKIGFEIDWSHIDRDVTEPNFLFQEALFSLGYQICVVQKWYFYFHHSPFLSARTVQYSGGWPMIPINLDLG